MQAGLVAQVHGDFDDIPLEDFPRTRKDGLRTSVNIRDKVQNQSGDVIYRGLAANEEHSNDTTSKISDNGNISNAVTEAQIETSSSEFITIPGEFMVIKNSDCNFAFETISEVTNTMIAPVEFDLRTIASDYAKERANIWMTGFYNNDGNADTGVAYGDNVQDDSDIGPVIKDSHINQLGLTVERGEEEVKFMITESGYVRVYSPSEYGTPSFTRLVKEFINKYNLGEREE